MALQPLSAPFGMAGVTHARRPNLYVPEGYIYDVNNGDDAFIAKGNRSMTLFPESSYILLHDYLGLLGSRQIHKFTMRQCTRIMIHKR